MEHVGPPEADLIAEAIAGNRESFAILCERYRNRVWRVVASVARGADADDLAQEAIVRAFSGLRTFRGDAPFAAWLCRIALHAAYDYQRSAWKRRILLVQQPPDQIDSQAVCPHGAAERKDTILRIRREVSLLPEALRNAVWLHYFEGFNLSDVARLESVPESTIRSRLRSGLRRLSLALSDLIEMEPLRTSSQRRCEA